MSRKGKILWLSIVGSALYTLVSVLEGCDSPNDKKETLTQTNTPAVFVGSSTCQSCIPTSFAELEKIRSLSGYATSS
jgi:hypothetical protein